LFVGNACPKACHRFIHQSSCCQIVYKNRNDDSWPKVEATCTYLHVLGA
jgi:hypothetical protein